MTSATVIAAKVFLVVLVIGTIVMQAFFLPVLAAEFAREMPEVDYLRVPLLVVAELVLVAVELVLVCMWRLLSMVRSNEIFSEGAFAWVNWIIGATIAATLLTAGVFIYLSVAYGGPPAITFFLLAMASFGATVALLMVVMKGLLRKATTLEAELSEVV